MARFVLYLLFFLIFYFLLRLFMKDIHGFQKRADRGSEAEELVQDPHCKTYVPKRFAIRKRVEGHDYYFCRKECLAKYLEDRKAHGS